jgi:hypothetical protein
MSTLRALPPEARVELTQCLDKNAGTRAICSVEATYACSAKALARVKPDPATADACERVIAVCGKKISMAESRPKAPRRCFPPEGDCRPFGTCYSTSWGG